MPATVTIVVKSVAQNDAIESTRKQLRGLEDDAKQGGTGFNAMQEMATGAFRYIGAQLVNLGGQLIGFAKQSLDVAGQFESGMNQFAAAAGGSLAEAGMDLSQFSSLFIQLGKELPVSTMEVQQAAVALVKGGIDPATIAAGALRDSLNFAAAAGMGLEAAAELTVKQLATFGPTAGTAAEQTAFMAEAQNLLVQAAGASTLNVDTLGQAMLAAGGQAKAVGMEYQDFVTTMGMISGSFSSAAEAGTSFKNFLTRIQPSSTPAYDAMESLGLITFDLQKGLDALASKGYVPTEKSMSGVIAATKQYFESVKMTKKEQTEFLRSMNSNAFYDAQGKFVGMAKASQLLQDATKNLTAEDKAKNLQLIFGNDAMNAAIALAAQGAAGYETIANKMALANGVTAQAAVVNQGYEFAANQLEGTIEALQIAIGTAFLPIVSKVTDVLGIGASVVLDFVMALQSDEVSMKNLAPPMQTVVTVLQQLTVYAKAAAAVFAGGAGIGSAITVFGTLVTNLNPTIGTFITNIGSFLTAIQTGDLSVLGTWGGAFTALQTIVQTVMTFLSTFIPSVLTTITSVWQTNGDSLTASNTSIWQSIGSIVTTVLQTVQAFIATVLPAILAFWDEHGASIVKTVTQTWETLNTIIATALGLIKTIVTDVLALVVAIWEVHGDTIMGIVGNAWIAIQAVINAALQIIQNLIQAALALFKGDFSGAWTHIQNATAAFTAALLVIIEQGFTAVWNAAKAILDTFVVGVEAIWTAIDDATNGKLAALVQAVGDWFNKIGDAIKGVIPGLKDTATMLGSDMVKGIIEGVTNAGSGLLDALKDLATRALNAAKEVLGISSPSKVFADELGTPMVDGIRMGWDTGTEALHRAVQTSLSAVVTTARDTIDRLDMPPLPAPTIEPPAWGEALTPPPLTPMTVPVTLSPNVGEALTQTVTVATGIKTYDDQITAFQQPFTNDMARIGTAMTGGLLDALKNGAPTVIDFLVSLSTDALDAAKKALGISSPSKAFADEVGAPMVHGIRVGWTRAMPMLRTALQTSLTATVDHLAPPLVPPPTWDDTHPLPPIAPMTVSLIPDVLTPPPLSPMTVPLVPDVLTPPSLAPMTVPVTPTFSPNIGEALTQTVTVATGVEPIRVPPPTPPNEIHVLDTIITKLSAGISDLITPITQATNAMTVAITDARHTTNTTLNQQRAFTYAPTFNGSDGNGLDMGMIRSLARTT